jgi:hypothetical protein
VLEKFTWDAKANQILQIYEAVVDRSRHLGSLHFGFRDLDAGARYAGAY